MKAFILCFFSIMATASISHADIDCIAINGEGRRVHIAIKDKKQFDSNGYKLVEVTVPQSYLDPKDMKNPLLENCGTARLTGVTNGLISKNYKSDLYIDCGENGKNGFFRLRSFSENYYLGTLTTPKAMMSVGLKDNETLRDMACVQNSRL